MNAPSNLPFRPCAGIFLLNKEDQIFIAQRADAPQNSECWQMPQGGIDAKESPLEGALRELKEETSIDSHNVTVLAESNQWREYYLPPQLIPRLWNGQFAGQTQKWFAMLYHGDNSDINLDTPNPELIRWRWASIKELPHLAISFKRKIYLDVIDEFKTRGILS